MNINFKYMGIDMLELIIFQELIKVLTYRLELNLKNVDVEGGTLISKFKHMVLQRKKCIHTYTCVGVSMSLYTPYESIPFICHV